MHLVWRKQNDKSDLSKLPDFPLKVLGISTSNKSLRITAINERLEAVDIFTRSELFTYLVDEAPYSDTDYIELIAYYVNPISLILTTVNFKITAKAMKGSSLEEVFVAGEKPRIVIEFPDYNEYA